MHRPTVVGRDSDRWIASGIVCLLLAIAGSSCLAAPDDAANDRFADVLLYAGEAVELPVPRGWKTYDWPFGREMRVLLSPGEPQVKRGAASDGVWLSHHLALVGDDKSEQRLEQILAQRLRLAQPGELQLNRPLHRQIGGCRAVLQEFETTGQQSPQRRGVHVLALAPWGLLEIHAAAPSEESAQRGEVAAKLLREIVIRDHPPIIERPVSSVAAAAPIVGAWKAYRSRMTLGADGRIEIAFDPPLRRPLDDSKAVVKQRLRGSFEAEGDILAVRWSDESLLNLRWKLHKGSLLLTDHDGRTTTLSPYLK